MSNLEEVISNYQNSTKGDFDRAAVEQEIDHWFFEDYFKRWVQVGAGELSEGPEFILNYWGRPMFATGDEPLAAIWLTTDEEVVRFLSMQHELLKAAGFDHTDVPDKKVRAYNPLAGAVEGIWSRCAADGTEIQRYVVHFEVAKIDGRWITLGIHSRTTDAEKDGGTVDGAWAL